jgi:hypothetical protein
MYPATKTFRAVEADKTAFPMPNTEPHSPLSKTATKKPKKTEDGATTVAGDDNNADDDDAAAGATKKPNYNDMFKLRNMQAVRHSFIPGKMTLAFLQEASNLRCIKSKPLVFDDEESEDEKVKSGKKKAKKRTGWQYFV